MTTTKKQLNSNKGAEEWLSREEKRINKIIENFSASFMSNAKWRKVLSLLANSRHLIESPFMIGRYRWKFVDSEKIYETPIIGIDELKEKHIKDGANQPFMYREVEWLEVVTEHTKEITDEFLQRGQFALDKSESGFKIIAYTSKVS
jgi:hypothetical protein